jgi:hypothetical protein
MSNWERLALGPRGRWLGKDRWPVAGAIAMIGAVVAASGGAWLEAALFFAAAVVLALMTVKSRAKRGDGIGMPDPRSVDNVDAIAASQSRDQLEPQGEAPGAVPPGYIKTYDEGRPLH